MSGMKKILSLAGAALLAGSFAASAATLSIVGGSASNLVAPKFNPAGGASLAASGLTAGSAVTAFDAASIVGGGLYLSGAAKLTLTFIGKEAGATDYVVELAGGTKIRNKLSELDTSISWGQSTGFVKFLFETLFPVPVGGMITNGVGSTDSDLGIAFSGITTSGMTQTVYALFDDGSPDNGPDRDYDDMIVRIDVASVPLPAGGVLLLTGLGGLALARRRKAA